MFDDQHDCQASVGSHVLRGKLVCMRVSLSATTGILSVLAPLLIKESFFLLSEYRQASERQELAHVSLFDCPELGVDDLDFECPFICGLGTGVLVSVLFPW